MTNPGELFLKSAMKEFQDYKKMGDKTFAQLNEADFHYQPNEECNSIAVIIQHLHGNMLSRWTNFLTEDGEKEWRKRDEEFEVHDFSKEKLMQLWEEGWSLVFNTIESLTNEDTGKTVFIRNEPYSVTGAVNKQMAHYAYHIGQIVFIAKIIREKNWLTISIPRNRPL